MKFFIKNVGGNKYNMFNLQGGSMEEVELNSISDTELKYYLPDCNIKTYPELRNIKDIEELLPENGSFLFFCILILKTLDTGQL